MKFVYLYSGCCGRRQQDTTDTLQNIRHQCLDQVNKVKSSMLVEFLFFYFLHKISLKALSFMSKVIQNLPSSYILHVIQANSIWGWAGVGGRGW